MLSVVVDAAAEDEEGGLSGRTAAIVVSCLVSAARPWFRESGDHQKQRMLSTSSKFALIGGKSYPVH